MLYSSYYGNSEKLFNMGFNENQLIRISLYECNWMKDLVCEKNFMVNKSDFIDYKNQVIDWKEYSYRYFNKLYNLEWYWLNYRMLFEYENCVFMCFEKDFHKCHRGLLMKFLNYYFGKVVMKEI